MIKSLRMIDFKSFADESLHVGPFTLIVGANASGKSNIRDAFRFLHGVSRGYTLAEIVGGKYGTDWKPIRGSVGGIRRFRDGNEFPSFALEAQMSWSLGFSGDTEPRAAIYRIEALPEEFSGGNPSIISESLEIDPKEGDSGKELHRWKNMPPGLQSGLHGLMRDAVDVNEYNNARQVIDTFFHARFFDLIPDRMRDPGLPSQTRLGDGGENLPVALQHICEDPERKSVLIDWVRELTPMDVKDLEFRLDPSGKTHLLIHELNGRKLIAESASDGTLRFLAMLAAFLGEDSGGLYFFEEIENGLHPSRLNLLVDLIERQTATGRVQVIATTHSPGLLSMVSDETFENVAVTCRLEDTNDAIIRRVADLPNAKKLRKTQGLGRLLAGGWMEDALTFTEGGDEDDGE